MLKYNSVVKQLSKRLYSMSSQEQYIYDKITKQLNPKSLQVADISGGCGSMFSIQVSSEKFKGLSIVKQHKLVNEILKDDIGKWHGLQLKTSSKV
ncbi:hypothetical protein TPHA_0H02970 [Tetrapisispora phaffii CBS 4417]|uniref:Bola-like protein n=1 Tax=Tetrapisispora phaffii (strain ATCC 24235 / CBS 4417 / NBRC 1672 / NRRL Y-8282 / UCD 70-5) TaxID=1071381 RepID=G8BWP9_TETPH|nr:hypothetical protein TPHA_0H02970 [Tetrapisispora phaffii CBS 4417]CCE64500.1 hypothetical protein TPHA_0H02970 [Tetrapisispora phaffii CBS 4417]